LADPSDAGDEVNKNIFDRKIRTKTLNMGLNGATKILNVNHHKTINVPDPEGQNGAVILQMLNRKILKEIEVNNQLESQRYLKLNGSSQMAGNLQLNNNKIVRLSDATAPNRWREQENFGRYS